MKLDSAIQRSTRGKGEPWHPAPALLSEMREVLPDPAIIVSYRIPISMYEKRVKWQLALALRSGT